MVSEAGVNTVNRIYLQKQVLKRPGVSQGRGIPVKYISGNTDQIRLSGVYRINDLFKMMSAYDVPQMQVADQGNPKRRLLLCPAPNLNFVGFYLYHSTMDSPIHGQGRRKKQRYGSRSNTGPA